MNTLITLDQLHGMPFGQVAALSIRDLANLLDTAVRELEIAKSHKAFLDGVLDHKFGERTAQLRQQKGKDFGTVRFQEDDFTIIADLPKRPAWDQKQLAAIVQRIRSAGDDPSDYVETTYKVPENRFKSWPGTIRRTFEPARTVKAGKAAFKLMPRNKETS